MQERTRQRLAWALMVWLGLILLWLIGGFASGSNPASPAMMIALAVGFWSVVLLGIVWFVARITAPFEREPCGGCGRPLAADVSVCPSCGTPFAAARRAG